ncbi:unnamed protein product [Ilex paraguariensis]|uniref:Agenet domain-containing protein n=1 Tax=Ilex paraguariensis TaxID=185542 RepID=A0ABC8RNV5_9AQUA
MGGGGAAAADTSSSNLGLQVLQIFTKGSQVEVTSNEEGFRGAWYVATILDPPSRSNSKKKNQNFTKVYLEYHSLLADEDGSKPLREHVNVSFIRPLPPPETAATRSFELNDVVDAFYRDGWWTGVITMVFRNSRFLVTFQNPPDEIEFGASDLRVHQEWVNGKWFRPQKQRTTGLMFSPGKKVEVSLNREDYRDVWFPAIVLEDFGNGSFLVEYQSSGMVNRAAFLKITVDYLHIRPSPPLLKDKNFVLLEKVDAFFDFGWWNGVITRELADSRYVVFFKHTNKANVLSESELRPHMEWKAGKWFSASQEVLVPPDFEEHIVHGCKKASDTKMASPLGSSGVTNGNSEKKTPSSINSKENQTEQSTSNNKKHLIIKTSLKKTTDQTPSHCDVPMLSAHKGMKSGFASPIFRNAGTNVSSQPESGDQPPSKSDSRSLGKRVGSAGPKVGEPDNHTTGPAKKKRRPAESPVNSSPHSSEGKEGYGVGNAARDIVEKGCATEAMELPVIIGLECNGMRTARTKKSPQFISEESVKLTTDQKQQLDDPATPINKVRI